MASSFRRTPYTAYIAALTATWGTRAKPFLASLVMRSNAKNDHIKKRHWCLGTLVILMSSWITHTTTATIEEHEPLNETELTENTPLVNDPALGFYSQASVSIESNFLDKTASSRLDKKVETETVQATVLVKAAPEVFTLRTHTVRKGESLGSIFKARKFDLAIPHNVSRHAVAEQLVALSIGRALTFKLDQEEQLQQIRYPVNSLQELVVDLDGTNIENAEISDLPYQMEQYSVSGEISSSLYDAALDAGLSIRMVMEMVNIFGWDIDFVLDIREGDEFHVVYEDYMMNGKKLADGHILAAEFTTQGQTHRAIRFTNPEGDFSYYTPSGESMLGTFLRSPVEFSRISSRFGKRKHPISKKWKAHKGVDYAAARGVPIRATADGKIIKAGRKGGYGNTIILRHAGRFTTLYAHMKGFAKGMRSGVRVKQGQTIGYVGTTGYSTGPHLHYEFRFDGVHRNPLTYKTPKASSIEPEFKTRFLAVSSHWENELDKLQKSYFLAKARSNISQL